jgi:[ribosomal protein S18]-alanine N-acetyltransferase
MTTIVESFESADHDAAADTPLRFVTEADLPALAILEKEIFGDLAYSSHLLRTFYSLFRTTWYVAEHHHALAGYALVGLSSDCRDGWLMGLAVHDRYQGRGLGRRLMDRALTSMMEYGVADAYLTVRPDNPAARHIYHSFAFAQQGETVPDYYGNGEPRDLLHRSLKTNPYAPNP